jgi:hypothetical protein
MKTGRRPTQFVPAELGQESARAFAKHHLAKKSGGGFSYK